MRSVWRRHDEHPPLPVQAALGVAAARHWAETTAAFFVQTPYHGPSDPIDRVLACVALRRSIIEGDLAQFTCLAGPVRWSGPQGVIS